jgi:hypothetical protein
MFVLDFWNVGAYVQGCIAGARRVSRPAIEPLQLSRPWALILIAAFVINVASVQIVNDNGRKALNGQSENCFGVQIFISHNLCGLNTSGKQSRCSFNRAKINATVFHGGLSDLV